MVCLVQTMHLSCTDNNIVSKRTETRLHMTHITKEFYRVCPKQFLSLWYVHRKPYAYLTSRLALSPKGPKRASISASSPRCTIGCIQNNFRAYGSFGANDAPMLHRHWHYLQMGRNEIPHYPCQLGVPSGASKTISKPMVHLAQTVHLSYIKISTIAK
jgi:hypothetical protein